MILLLGLALFFAFQSSALSINRPLKVFILCLFLLLVIIFLIFYIFKRNNQKSNTQRLETLFWIALLVLVVFQLFLQPLLQVKPLYDAAFLIDRAQDVNASLSKYLSQYPNNILMFLINRATVLLFGNFLWGFEIVGIVMINLSIILLKVFAEKLFKNKAIGVIAALLLIFYTGIQPLFLVPYTDTYSLAPTLAAMLCLLLAVETRKIGLRILFSSFCGLFFIISYLIKPSTVVWLIAVSLFALLNLFNKDVRKKVLILLPSFLVTAAFSLFLFNITISHQKDFTINHNASFPWTHFLLIGSYGNSKEPFTKHGIGDWYGGWNMKDVNLTSSQKTYGAKEKVDLQAFVARTKARGFVGTIYFYIQKFRLNIDTGVVGYHRDGLWLPTHSFSSKGTLKNKMQQIFYPDGNYRSTFNFICQLIWIPTLFFAIIGLWKYRKNDCTFLVAFSLFGGILFLLLFESGGTKYLLQYLPLLLMLSAVGFYETGIHLKSIRKSSI